MQLEPSQLPRHSLVVLGGCDELLHGEEVATALAAEAIARQGHAQVSVREPRSGAGQAGEALATARSPCGWAKQARAPSEDRPAGHSSCCACRAPGGGGGG